MKKPKSFDTWALEEQEKWIDQETQKTQQLIYDLRRLKAEIKIADAKAKIGKPIKRRYSLWFTDKKNRLIHEIGRGDIKPLEYFDARWGERIKGKVCHVIDNGTSYQSYGWMEVEKLKPITWTKIKNTPDSIVIHYTHGLICRKCKEFVSDYSNEVIQAEKDFSEIESRKQLADFIKKAKKSAINITDEMCRSCSYFEEKALKKMHLEELEKHSKARRVKTITGSKGVATKDAYKFLELANAASSIASYKPTHKI